jgi:splicing factor 3B subunit 1
MDDEMPIEEQKQRKILMLILRIKNGNISMRKSAIKTITLYANELGAENLFDRILPILTSE